MMWQIITTDENFDPYENNLVWRVAELIGISTREKVQIKKGFFKQRYGNQVLIILPAKIYPR
ncbi:MAG: hypothetical protein CM15mP111_4080 [Hyphomicrobiales bacterium]|nr:MAG: hypothetical protein CM15mP111_4080 [Hyphomicrobiales bacterium]